MNNSLSSKEFKMFKKYIEEKCGILISEHKSYLIESRLSKLLAEYDLSSFENLYYKVYSSKNKALEEKVIDSITTNETLWFRDRTPWDIINDKFMDVFINKLRNKDVKKIKIWSAASSTGQEAYSTAIMINEYLESNKIKDIKLEQFEILGTDISNPVLNIAKNGKYDSISIMRGLDDKYKNKYFEREGRTWKISEDIKSIVRFKKANLQNHLTLKEEFDIIFLRYVLIYFSNELKDEILLKVYKSLKKDGALFLGNSEILNIRKDIFVQKKYKNGVFYLKEEC